MRYLPPCKRGLAGLYAPASGQGMYYLIRIYYYVIPIVNREYIFLSTFFGGGSRAIAGAIAAPRSCMISGSGSRNSRAGNDTKLINSVN